MWFIPRQERKMGKFSGKRILITGGASGIGLLGAKRIIEQGGTVAVTNNSRENLERAGSDLPPEAIVLDNDVADLDAAQLLAEKAKQIGAFDGFWLNAGSDLAQSAEDIDEEFFDRMMHVNVRRPSLQMARLAGMLKPGGSIVLTALASACEHSPMASLYAAAESAMVSMAQCWAAALAERNIRVHVLVPGPINTSFGDDLRAEFRAPLEEDPVSLLVPLGWSAAPDEAAEVALLLLSGERAEVSASRYALHRALTMR
jgi:NAD(P)-dependent dehydrogenase (short-subunit alcohol dehydrogenase family)